jgi:phosphotransferase system enzyme I (PtsI)/phosphotransferase system enzyme I (PtsP)
MENLILELPGIVQAVSHSRSAAQRVNIIVESISRVMAIDVCSLYLPDEQGNMHLIASHGLAPGAVGKVSLPAGKGLVGQVAQIRHPLNVANARDHVAFYYLEKTREEDFASFFGAPLVRAGRVRGVLVVQGSEARKLSLVEEAFLVTLAAQLAFLVGDLNEDASNNQRVAGVAGAPGVAIGEVHWCDSGELYAVADAPCDSVASELANWFALLEQVKQQLVAEQLHFGDGMDSSIKGIFTAHQMLLSDPVLVERVAGIIRQGQWLPAALRDVIKQLGETFAAMDDPYLKAREEDIHQLGNKLYNQWRGLARKPVATDQPLILVGAQVGVSDIAALAPEQLAGIVCFGGSSLSHTAVLANAMGVPAVMGTGSLTQLSPGASIVVDGNVGQVFINPNDALLAEFKALVARDRAYNASLAELRDLSAMTLDGDVVKLFTNTGLLADITPGLNSGAEGVGLYRTEIPFMVHDGFPSEDEQVRVYRQVLEAYRGKPVSMRVLDVGGDKQLPYFPIGNEENPALGWRGIRFCLDNSALLMTQVRAMLRASEGLNNLKILLPMITSFDELNSFRELLSDAQAQLQQEGCGILPPEVGVMVEVPAVISQLPQWKNAIDFVSIGSNDLSQYLLAMDRNNARVSHRYDILHPAVLMEIRRVVSSASQLGLPLSLCGEMASDPLAVILLLGMGVRTLSLSAAKLPRIKHLIRSLTTEDAERLLAKAMRMGQAAAIRAMLEQELAALGLTALLE